MKKIFLAGFVLISFFAMNYIICNNKDFKDAVTKFNDKILVRDKVSYQINNLEKEKEQLEKDISLVTEKNNNLEIEIQRLEKIPKFKAGEIITFGKYAFVANGTEMPIDWIIVGRIGSKALIVSRHSLDYGKYDDKIKWNAVKNLGWVNSSIRKWLNGEFMNKAFSNIERECIVKSYSLTHESDSNFQRGICRTRYKSSEDYVLLYSEHYDYMFGFSLKLLREISKTPYANSKYNKCNYSFQHNYYKYYKYYYWNYCGEGDWVMDYDYCDVDSNIFVSEDYVLPFMWIDLKKAFPEYSQQNSEKKEYVQSSAKAETLPSDSEKK